MDACFGSYADRLYPKYKAYFRANAAFSLAMACQRVAQRQYGSISALEHFAQQNRPNSIAAKAEL